MPRSSAGDVEPGPTEMLGPVTSKVKLVDEIMFDCDDDTSPSRELSSAMDGVELGADGTVGS